MKKIKKENIEKPQWPDGQLIKESEEKNRPKIITYDISSTEDDELFSIIRMFSELFAILNLFCLMLLALMPTIHLFTLVILIFNFGMFVTLSILLGRRENKQLDKFDQLLRKKLNDD